MAVDENGDWIPFTSKPKHLKVGHIKRKEKWDSEEDVEDLSHRRFSITLQVPQLVNAFKKSVRNGEVKRSVLITCYRVVLERILQDPDLTDEEIFSMYRQIQTRATEAYGRRAKRYRNIKT